MKIYTKIVMDTMTGQIEESESFEYDGPVAKLDIFGGGGSTSTTTVVNQPAEMTQEERDLLVLNKQLAERQIKNIDALQPYQQELLDLSLADLRRNAAVTGAIDAAITPEQQAAAAKTEFERAQRLGPIQDEVLQLQLDALRSGGAATPEQLARIKAATEAGITAGTGDIDAQTARGIGMIADELANSRGLRLSDSPISSEAALLAREGEIQKGSLTRNMRAAEASSALNYPLAAQQIFGAQNQSQQGILQSAQQFQQQLRQQAFQNRLALTGPAVSGGIGMASIGSGYRPSFNRGNTSTQTTDTSGGGMNLQGIGSLASGVGALWTAFSDRRLKHDYGVVAKTRGGLKLHLFKYKGEGAETPLRLGVMADEVKRIRPDAVRRHSSGFDAVDYSKVA